MRSLAWPLLLVCACADGPATASAPVLAPCEQAADTLERAALGQEVDPETYRTIHQTLVPGDGEKRCEPAIMKRAAQASLELLDDDRAIYNRGEFSMTWRVQHFAHNLLGDMTGQNFGYFNDVRIIESWRAWWAKSGADVERWLREGDEKRRKDSIERRAAATKQLTEMHFVATDAMPLSTWDPRWPALAHLEEVTGYARYGRNEFAASLPARLGNLPEGRSLFVRDGDDIVGITVGRQPVPGVETRAGTWAAVTVSRHRLTRRMLQADAPDARFAFVWPRELGDLSLAVTPPLDDHMLAWIEQHDPDMHAHLFHLYHFQALVLDGTVVRRVRLQLLEATAAKPEGTRSR